MARNNWWLHCSRLTLPSTHLHPTQRSLVHQGTVTTGYRRFLSFDIYYNRGRPWMDRFAGTLLWIRTYQGFTDLPPPPNPLHLDSQRSPSGNVSVTFTAVWMEPRSVPTESLQSTTNGSHAIPGGKATSGASYRSYTC